MDTTWGWEELGDRDWHIYTIDTRYEIANEQEHTLQHRGLSRLS